MARKWNPTPEVLAKIKELAELGVTEANIARQVGIHPTTFSEKKRVYPEIDEILRTAAASGEEFAAKVVRSIMANPNHKQQLAATIFYLKTRHKWKEADTVQAEAPKEEPQGFNFTLVQVDTKDE